MFTGALGGGESMARIYTCDLCDALTADYCREDVIFHREKVGSRYIGINITAERDLCNVCRIRVLEELAKEIGAWLKN